jgi:hypothetical protein
MYAILSNFTEDEVENIKFIDIIDEAEYKEYMANYCNDRIRDVASPPQGVLHGHYTRRRVLGSPWGR